MGAGAGREGAAILAGGRPFGLINDFCTWVVGVPLGDVGAGTDPPAILVRGRDDGGGPISESCPSTACGCVGGFLGGGGLMDAGIAGGAFIAGGCFAITGGVALPWWPCPLAESLPPVSLTLMVAKVGGSLTMHWYPVLAELDSPGFVSHRDLPFAG